MERRAEFVCVYIFCVLTCFLTLKPMCEWRFLLCCEWLLHVSGHDISREGGFDCASALHSHHYHSSVGSSKPGSVHSILLSFKKVGIQ